MDTMVEIDVIQMNYIIVTDNTEHWDQWSNQLRKSEQKS